MAKKEDSRLPVARSWQLLLLGVVFGLALALVGPGTVSAQEGEMVADCEGNSPAVDTDCEFGDGQEFSVSIQLASAPDGGFLFFQAKLRWDGDVLDYLATSDPAQEVVWPGCDIPARGPDMEASVFFACVPFSQQTTDYVGPLLLYTFVCAGQGTASLELVPAEDDGQGGTSLADENLQPIAPALAGASVTCGGADQPRPDPEVTVNAPPPFDPEDPRPPETTPDDSPRATVDRPVTTPGDVTPATPGTPGTPEATGEPAALRLGDDDDDDDGLPVWAWTLIGLAIAAAVGGGGFVAWRRMQARGEGEEPDQPRGEGEEPDQARGEGEEPDQARGEGEEPDQPRGEGEEPNQARGEGEEPDQARGEGEEPDQARGEGEDPDQPHGEGEEPDQARGEGEEPDQPS